ncbi:UDP-N-acetylglucosamine (UAA) transporter family [Actinidia rufa]|uniref:UDP-N-acetylglucosamine (UAA) transporter family n=1 Tax=Actinidia rufa TaxID=165716 RepID=A0A7J0GBN0_9ERIC|nr:UDP-N-acetylglucosamine (UAA) transporter family [Actinidia rufa]
MPACWNCINGHGFHQQGSSMKYAHSMTLLTLQQLVTTLLIHCGRVMGYTKAKGLNIATAKKLILVSLFYNANVAFALASLKGVNILMYIAIKRLTPLAVLVAGFFSGKGRPSTQCVVADLYEAPVRGLVTFSPTHFGDALVAVPRNLPVLSPNGRKDSPLGCLSPFDWIHDTSCPPPPRVVPRIFWLGVGRLCLPVLARPLLHPFGRLGHVGMPPFADSKAPGPLVRMAAGILALVSSFESCMADMVLDFDNASLANGTIHALPSPMMHMVSAKGMGNARTPSKNSIPTQWVTLSVILIAAGVIIAALGDFSFDLVGYSTALTSVFFQTMYLVLVEKSGAEDGLSSIEIMFYNSFLSLPFLIVLIIATGEFPNSLSILFAKGTLLSLSVILLLSLVMGIVLNYTMFLCTVVNSALTTTIVGVLKGVGSTTLAFVLLGGVEVHTLNASGLAINTAGGMWYSYAKYQQK